MEPQIFDSTTFDFGTQTMLLNGEENVIDFKFPVLNGVVEHVRKGCGCTDAFYDNGVVRGSLNLKSALGLKEREEKGEYLKAKTVTVYFQDGEPLKVVDGTKEKYNNEKKQVTLYIKGTIVVEQSA